MRTIGTTSSGKPIYAAFQLHRNFDDWSPDDHVDAAEAHRKAKSTDIKTNVSMHENSAALHDQAARRIYRAVEELGLVGRLTRRRAPGKSSGVSSRGHARRKRVPEPPKSRAQIKREVDEVLARKPGGALGGGAESLGDGGLERARETSERRIAALIANGEDVRNTPSWRDAVAERRMIDLMSRAGTVPSGRRFGIDRSKHTRVDIRWYAIPNQNKASGGFLPMIEEDGRARGDTWSRWGYDKAEAEAMAEERAHEAASRFVGDWNVVVKKGRPARQ